MVGGSDTTLAEVCGVGRPVFLVSPPTATERRSSVPERLREALADIVLARARARPTNDRGTTRPQEGLEWLAARLVASGFVRPRRPADALRARLLASGHARMLSVPLSGTDLDGFPASPSSELERVAARVHALLGTNPTS